MANSQKITAPPLMRVPGATGDPLTLRLSHTGVTMLREGSYRKRYAGGESVVDINGKLHLSRQEYKNLLIEEEKQREQWKISMGIPQKKSRLNSHEKPGAEKSTLMDSKGTAKVVNTKKTHYRVNKTEVTNRLVSMTNAMFSNVQSGAFMGMITISFPPAVNDFTAMKALNTWLTVMRQKGKRLIKNYLWVAERQDGKRLADQSKATNTIHFHLIILNRVNIQYANRAMRIILCNLIRNKEIDYPLQLMKRYNGVDLAKNRVTRQVTNFCDKKSRKALFYYITKYVTKNDAAFKVAAWSCSRAFSAIFTAITCSYQEFIRMELNYLAWQEPVISNQWFDFFPWLAETGPPPTMVNHLSQLNLFVLEKRGLLN